jgi:hypothetical protein
MAARREILRNHGRNYNSQRHPRFLSIFSGSDEGPALRSDSRDFRVAGSFSRCTCIFVGSFVKLREHHEFLPSMAQPPSFELHHLISQTCPALCCLTLNFRKRRWGRTRFAQDPASGRLEINVADFMLAEQRIECRQVFPYQLLKVCRRFVAPLLQLFLHGRLLGGWRKICTAIELVE